ncbi:hypothetical protein [Mucilaginibacter ginsenosidivorans]|uniref:Uncharacterized protein n=1 Tax=Mucilaginibacter ginsenosidivorans TaxID=398053 RepID=A0A5B8URQ6_9SPHI|nr:hypothetical protein [Mucilaginibacter ginsenosidivorans]QEC61757.1 hypothetical protein FRZ54_03870 [Mucilaginibacter ginsenosidivorans]
MKRVVVVVISVFSIIVLIKSCQIWTSSNALKVNKEISRLDSNTYSKSFPADYLNLFLDKKNIVIDSSLISKHRSPVTEFHTEKYYIQVYRIPSSAKFSTKSNIIYKTNNTSEMSRNTYYVDATTISQFKVKYKLDSTQPISSLYFSLFGSQTQLIRTNDSIAYYFSNFSNFSIRFKEGNVIDIYGKVGNKNREIPIEIMFLKRKECIYFILLANRNFSLHLEHNALFDLITK